MKLIFESAKIALKSVFANKLRSFLTILGIVVGIVTICSLLSIALGVRSEITKQIEDLGSNFIAVVPGQIQQGGGFDPTAQIGASTLTESDYEQLKVELPELKNLSIAMLLTGNLKFGQNASPGSIIFASSEKILPLINSRLEKGRFLDEVDVSSSSRVIVLGAKPAKNLFGDTNPIGQFVDIRGEQFEVIGVLAEKETAQLFSGPDVNDLTILPISTGWEITNTKQIIRIMMQSPDAGSINDYKAKVKDILLKNHGGEEDFSVLTQDDIIGIIGDILNILTAMLGAISAISLFVGGIGIMNIMLVSVTERTKEIGIRKSVGATNQHILIQFLIESVTLSIFGGILGVLIALGGSIIANNYSPLPVSLPISVIGLALGFSALVGAIFGVAPAISAARKDPIAALRSE